MALFINSNRPARLQIPRHRQHLISNGIHKADNNDYLYPAVSRQCSTKRNQQTDMPSSTSRGINKKRYRKIKSRYMENSVPMSLAVAARRVAANGSLSSRKCVWLKEERARLAIYNDPRELRAAMLPPAEFIYLDMVETDGRLDQMASAFSYLLKIDDERIERLLRSTKTTVPSIRKYPHLLTKTKDALTRNYEPEWPLDMLRAAFVYVGDGHDERWLRSAELYFLAAASQVTGNGCPDEATCLLAAGWFYGHAGAANTLHDPLQSSIKFLDEARRASVCHATDWIVPPDIRNAIEYASDPGAMDGIGDSVWALACFYEHEALVKAARKMSPEQALRAVRVAHRLVRELSVNGLDRRHLAAAAYELGVRYATVGAIGRAAEAFGECAVSAAGLHSGLDLDALLEIARITPGLSDEDVLERIADECLERRNVRTLVKTIAARGRLAANAGRSIEAYNRYSVAHRLATTDAGESNADVTDAARLHAAINNTCAFWKFNYQSLSERSFGLLVEPLMWTGDRRNWIVPNRLDGMMYINADCLQDIVVKSQVRKLHQKLGISEDDCDNDAATSTRQDSRQSDNRSVDIDDEKQLKKKQVQIEGLVE